MLYDADVLHCLEECAVLDKHIQLLNKFIFHLGLVHLDGDQSLITPLVKVIKIE